MSFLIFLLAITLAGETRTETKTINKESALVSFMKGKSGKSEKRLRRLARLFIQNGERWELDPGLVACVAYKESTYRIRPRKIRRCRTKIQNGSAVQICGIINAPEVGVMQILPHDRSTRVGWRLCTGRKRWRRRADLRRPVVNVCIGTYELHKWRKWTIKRGHWWRPLHRWHKRFYRKNPELRPFHWVASSNWGPRRRPRFKFKIGYPVRVFRCYRDFLKHKRRVVSRPVKEKQVRGAPR